MAEPVDRDRLPLSAKIPGEGADPVAGGGIDPAPAVPLLDRRAFLVGGAVLALSACTPRWQDGQSQRSPTSYGGNLPHHGATDPVSPAPASPEPVLPESQAIPGDGYVIIPRRAWTNLPIKGNNNPMGQVTRLTVHHTGEHGSWSDIPDVEVVRRIEQYHRGERGWACIGYHFIVGRDGRVYEGRPARFQGAHVSTQNENNLGISVVGDFTNRSPTPRQLAALRSLLDDKRRQYAVPGRRVYGHRELHPSECPGDVLMAWVRKYRAA